MSAAAQKQGIGAALINALIESSEAELYWTVSAEILADNHASRALHKKCGFREVGYRERIGQLDGVWHDTILLERRSQLVGGPSLPARECDKAKSALTLE